MPTVRHATPADIPQLVDAYDWLFAPPGLKPPHWDPVVAADRLTRVIAGPRTAVLVATEQDQVVGFCTLYLDIESVRFGQRCWLEDLAVSPTQRSTGVGTTLLTTAHQWAASNGADHLELDSANTRTDAHRFYHRHNPGALSTTFSWHLA
ncbi:GCN5-related N-acetyltransferase [Kribbella flavida DSM 17836]|uniref:GCN5-related N-acetyltransferase n=1 Tax=Kribbella flavida (strain DSM 17836 / JCM 10339 / NBRC 14399) TaxID=479435 RepID=D2Q2X6_KRIFD|nr:GNAT family N-acetyltransferase [Kribbella flavida]ADB30307.1 GCN5-related N-acetyltransferase [Kribbella flavida DSM 17836]